MTIADLPRSALTLPTRAPVDALAEGALALRVAGFLSAEECQAFARGVYAGRAAWVADFDGDQFSLGRAFYTHFEQERAALYFAQAAAADADVERFCPGLQARMLEAAQGLVRAAVVRRRGWCGPGVHVFPAGSDVALEGGVVHFDTEGLSPACLAALAPAYTLVAMIAAPEAGGALRVWDHRFDGERPEEAPAGAASVDVSYGEGDLVVIDSYRLHQIQPFSGARDRISATAHVAQTAGGRFEAWF